MLCHKIRSNCLALKLNKPCHALCTTSISRMSSGGICHLAVGGRLFRISSVYSVSSMNLLKKLLPILALMVGLLSMYTTPGCETLSAVAWASSGACGRVQTAMRHECPEKEFSLPEKSASWLGEMHWHLTEMVRMTWLGILCTFLSYLSSCCAIFLRSLKYQLLFCLLKAATSTGCKYGDVRSVCHVMETSIFGACLRLRLATQAAHTWPLLVVGLPVLSGGTGVLQLQAGLPMFSLARDSSILCCIGLKAGKLDFAGCIRR